MLEKLISKNRSYRRFDETFPIERDLLVELVSMARLSPSAANLQPLKYILSNTKEKNALIFPHLYWAGYLKDWQGPSAGERPSAYIVVLGDNDITDSFDCNHGIAAQSMLLRACEKGLGGCIIGSIDREGLRRSLSIPDKYKILVVIAIGKSIEKIVIEDLPAGGDIKYWRDSKGVHHVPKRNLDEIILN